MDFHHHAKMAIAVSAKASKLETLLWGDWCSDGYWPGTTDEDRAALQAARTKALELREACEALKARIWKGVPKP